MLTPSYDMLLVIASIGVSIMASFTGLTLTRGISSLPDVQRKFMIVMAALSLGGGIWSMHFVAMLAMNLPVPISYDAVSTLGSALLAVLMSGIAFLILHYIGRSWRWTVLAGIILGNGIVAMHYLGMSGIRGCLPLFKPEGVALAIVGASIMGIVALRISYMARGTANLFAGAVTFGLSVVLVHFVAMGWTGLGPGERIGEIAPIIDHGMLAIFVMLSAFAICGTFLLTAANFVLGSEAQEKALVLAASGVAEASVVAPPAAAPMPMPVVTPDGPQAEHYRLPYERDKRIHFIEPARVAAVRAEGHYSILYTEDDKLFCPLSISALEKRLEPYPFLRTHRSYLVNIEKVTAFERVKDNGRCLFDGIASLKSVPVSRAFVARVRTSLSI